MKKYQAGSQETEEKVGSIRILHEFQVWIDKSALRVTLASAGSQIDAKSLGSLWHQQARRLMLNYDPRDRFVYPYLLHIIISFSCTS